MCTRGTPMRTKNAMQAPWRDYFSPSSTRLACSPGEPPILLVISLIACSNRADRASLFCCSISVKCLVSSYAPTVSCYRHASHLKARMQVCYASVCCMTISSRIRPILKNDSRPTYHVHMYTYNDIWHLHTLMRLFSFCNSRHSCSSFVFMVLVLVRSTLTIKGRRWRTACLFGIDHAYAAFFLPW